MENETEERETMTTRILSGIVFLSGVWLIISPFIFSYTSTGLKWDQIIVGIIIAILGIVRFYFADAIWSSWLSALAGLWMIIAPLIISGASTAVFWSSIVGGAVALILSLVATGTYSQTHHVHHSHPAT